MIGSPIDTASGEPVAGLRVSGSFDPAPETFALLQLLALARGEMNEGSVRCLEGLTERIRTRCAAGQNAGI